jgi:beta-lactam-binding protein with PASTA domain
MITAEIENGDVLFGLHSEEVNTLKKGNIITIDIKEDMVLSKGRKIFIIYGETENDILSKLINEDKVTPETEINM